MAVDRRRRRSVDSDKGLSFGERRRLDGEKWGRHWLDLARYAESEGFKADETRPHAWRYRD
jgi:hypothetical protein